MFQVGGPGGLQGCGDGVLWATRHQIGGLVWLQSCEVARLWDGALRSTRHQVGVVPGPARLWDGALWATRHQIGGPGVAARLWG